MEALIILALLAGLAAWGIGRFRKRATGQGVAGKSYINMAVAAVLVILVLYAISQN